VRLSRRGTPLPCACRRRTACCPIVHIGTA
jgi:hypothetical protein